MFRETTMILVCSVIFALPGCESHDAPVLPVSLVDTEATTENEDRFPFTIVDRLDRKVEFASAPKRIVSVSPNQTEMIYFLGAEDRLVGVTAYCNYPPEAQDKPQIGGGTNESISRETLLSLEPDLVLCKWDNHAPLIEQLEEWNIPALALGAESFDGMYEELRILGRITGRSETSNRLVAQMQQRVETILDAVEAKSGEPPKVFYQVWDEPLMSAGPDSFIGKVLELAGTENILQGTSIRYPKVNSEVVIAANPEIIIAPSSHSEPTTRESILEREGWQNVSAIQTGRVYLIAGDRISRCAPRLVDALEEIVITVHGESLLKPTGATP